MDADHVLFVRSTSLVQGDLHLVTVSTGAVSSVLTEVEVDRTPGWSPDGLSITFVRSASAQAGPRKVCVMNVGDASSLREVSGQADVNEDPDWGPVK